MLATLEHDTNCAVSWRARPGSFVSLMSLYESNYIRLAGLVPDLHRVEGSHVSRVAGDCALHLAVDERSRYTTTFRLTYVFDDEQIEWIEKELTDSGSDWKIAFFHHPLYSSGEKHGPDRLPATVGDPVGLPCGWRVGHESSGAPAVSASQVFSSTARVPSWRS